MNLLVAEAVFSCGGFVLSATARVVYVASYSNFNLEEFVRMC